MKKKGYAVLSLTIAAVICSSSLSSAGEREGLIKRLRKRFIPKRRAVPAASDTPAPLPPAKKSAGAEVRPALTKEAILDYIRGAVEFEDVLAHVPELKRQPGGEGAASYTYALNGRDIRLEELSAEELENVFRRVQQTMNALNTERLNKQLDAIQRQAQQLQQINQAARAQSSGPPPRPPQPPPQPPPRR